MNLITTPATRATTSIAVSDKRDTAKQAKAFHRASEYRLRVTP